MSTGVVYAVKNGKQWYRALIDMYGEMVFYVDIGYRRLFHPSMMFHELPGRYVLLYNWLSIIIVMHNLKIVI